jgi:hypothetical protein
MAKVIGLDGRTRLDYDVKVLLSKKEQLRFNKDNPAHLAVLEARQQERERRKRGGVPQPDRESDVRR